MLYSYIGQGVYRLQHKSAIIYEPKWNTDYLPETQQTFLYDAPYSQWDC